MKNLITSVLIIALCWIVNGVVASEDGRSLLVDDSASSGDDKLIRLMLTKTGKKRILSTINTNSALKARVLEPAPEEVVPDEGDAGGEEEQDAPVGGGDEESPDPEGHESPVGEDEHGEHDDDLGEEEPEAGNPDEAAPEEEYAEYEHVVIPIEVDIDDLVGAIEYHWQVALLQCSDGMTTQDGVCTWTAFLQTSTAQEGFLDIPAPIQAGSLEITVTAIGTNALGAPATVVETVRVPIPGSDGCECTGEYIVVPAARRTQELNLIPIGTGNTYSPGFGMIAHNIVLPEGAPFPGAFQYQCRVAILSNCGDVEDFPEVRCNWTPYADGDYWVNEINEDEYLYTLGRTPYFAFPAPSEVPEGATIEISCTAFAMDGTVYIASKTIGQQGTPVCPCMGPRMYLAPVPEPEPLAVFPGGAATIVPLEPTFSGAVSRFTVTAQTEFPDAEEEVEVSYNWSLIIISACEGTSGLYFGGLNPYQAYVAEASTTSRCGWTYYFDNTITDEPLLEFSAPIVPAGTAATLEITVRITAEGYSSRQALYHVPLTGTMVCPCNGARMNVHLGNLPNWGGAPTITPLPSASPVVSNPPDGEDPIIDGQDTNDNSFRPGSPAFIGTIAGAVIGAVIIATIAIVAVVKAKRITRLGQPIRPPATRASHQLSGELGGVAADNLQYASALGAIQPKQKRDRISHAPSATGNYRSSGAPLPPRGGAINDRRPAGATRLALPESTNATVPRVPGPGANSPTVATGRV